MIRPSKAAGSRRFGAGVLGRMRQLVALKRRDLAPVDSNETAWWSRQLRCLRPRPLDRKLCVPTFRWVCDSIWPVSADEKRAQCLQAATSMLHCARVLRRCRGAHKADRRKRLCASAYNGQMPDPQVFSRCNVRLARSGGATPANSPSLSTTSTGSPNTDATRGARNRTAQNLILTPRAKASGARFSRSHS